jgi:hypothetical protein
MTFREVIAGRRQAASNSSKRRIVAAVVQQRSCRHKCTFGGSVSVMAAASASDIKRLLTKSTCGNDPCQAGSSHKKVAKLIMARVTPRFT